jgi:hypothetical protein
MEFALSFGAMSDPIADQLARQGIQPPPGRSVEWDRWNAAVVRLAVNGLVTQAERERAHQRIVKSIAREIRQHQKAAARLANHRERA